MNETLNKFIPSDDDEAQRRFDACRLASWSALAKMETDHLLRAWWGFLWLNPSLHPDDARVWPASAKLARRLAAEMFKRFVAGELTDEEYYPSEMLRRKFDKDRPATEKPSGASSLSWKALVYLCGSAGAIFVNDEEAVTYSTELESDDEEDSMMILLTPYGESMSHIVRQRENAFVVVRGSNVRVTADVLNGDDSQEIQLNFFKTWVVEDDLNLNLI